MTRSEAACRRTIFQCSEQRDVYLWTFTFADVLPIDVAVARWDLLRRQLIRRLGFSGVRVFELHPGGHGLHVHVVTWRREEVELVRPLSDAAGFGRIDVVHWTGSPPVYVAKYLSKSRDRDEMRCLKGRRLWMWFGPKSGYPVARVRDVTEPMGPVGHAMRSVSMLDAVREQPSLDTTDRRRVNYARFCIAQRIVYSPSVAVEWTHDLCKTHPLHSECEVARFLRSGGAGVPLELRGAFNVV